MFAFDLAMSKDFVTENHRVATMLGFFSQLSFRRIREIAMWSQKVRVGAAIAMFHDVDISNFVKLHSDIEMLEEDVTPRRVSWLHDTQSRPCEDKLVVTIREVVTLHEIADVIKKAQIHAAEQEHIAAGSRVWTTFRKATMDFHD